MSDASSPDRFVPRPVPPRPGAFRGAKGGARPTNTSASPTWPLWVPIVALVLLSAVLFIPRYSARHSDTVSYGQLLREQLPQDQVRTLVITTPSGHATGEYVDGRVFRTTVPIPLSDPVEQRLREQTEELRFVRASPPFFSSGLGLLVPLVLLGLIFGWVLRRFFAQGQYAPAGMAGTRDQVWESERPHTVFADIAGYAEVKAEITEVVDFFRRPAHFRAIGAHLPKGLLLVGPPGTGKTLFARAVAGEAGVPFFSVGGSDFMEMFVGVGARRVRELFAAARAQSPCIVFVDEIDSIGRRRSSNSGMGNDEREQTLNQLLNELDGFAPTEGIVVLAATNRPEVLDPALLRPGRFDRQVLVPLPELSERLAILQVHCRDKPVAADLSLTELAQLTSGMSGADLANLTNEAALHAVRRGATQLATTDFDAARDRILMGASREALVLSSLERFSVAVHEAGHAVLAELLPHADIVQKVSILPRGQTLGSTLIRPLRDRHRLSEDEVRDRIAVALGGRVAEQLVFDQRSTAASDDLALVTGLARQMVVEWGMSPVIGAVSIAEAGGDGFVGWSSSIAGLVDDEVRKIVRVEEARVTILLEANRSILDAVTDALLARETIDGAEVARLAGRGASGDHASGGESARQASSGDPGAARRVGPGGRDGGLGGGAGRAGAQGQHDLRRGQSTGSEGAEAPIVEEVHPRS